MKLKLNYISDVIGNDYVTNWKDNDVVLLTSQTGTGKTTFILDHLLDTMVYNEKLIYICNRIELSRHIKMQLIKKYNLRTPKTDDELDSKSMFRNVRVTTYQAISSNIKSFNLQSYKYQIMDEAHFWSADSTFNNTSHLTFFEIVRKHYYNSIRIVISATLKDIQPAIKAGMLNQSHSYDTGRDYSYLNSHYFNKMEDILQLIKNDRTDDKWLIFVTSKKKGYAYEKDLLHFGINAKFVHAQTKKKVIINEQFSQKVLIATKFIDNGINIHDDQVNHIVVNTYDETTFIQEIGRVRVDINDARSINLYIPTLNAKTFNTLIKLQYEKKLKQMEEYNTDQKMFQEKYQYNHQSVSKQLFYLNDDNEWKDNLIGYSRLLKDNNFAYEMVDMFYNNKYAYVETQLDWIGHTFNTSKLIENVIDNTEVVILENYLNSIVGKRLYTEEQFELSNIIMNELISIDTNVDYRTKKLNHRTLESIIRDQLELPFVVSKPKRDKRRKLENGMDNANRDKSFITISKI